MTNPNEIATIKLDCDNLLKAIDLLTASSDFSVNVFEEFIESINFYNTFTIGTGIVMRCELPKRFRNLEFA